MLVISALQARRTAELFSVCRDRKVEVLKKLGYVHAMGNKFQCLLGLAMSMRCSRIASLSCASPFLNIQSNNERVGCPCFPPELPVEDSQRWVNTEDSFRQPSLNWT